jgi:peptide/nickel transport system substrate-binding protein
MQRWRVAIALVFGVAVAMGPGAGAETFRWSSGSDITTLDPTANPDAFSDGILNDIYERLATRDKDFNFTPALAVRWQQVNPTTLRFFLRADVRFHDGTILTADDVVFSLLRARRPTSDHKEAMTGVKTVVKVDALTVDVISEKPMAPLLAHVATLGIMSKAWLTRHNAVEPHDYAGNKESHAARQAMGTGPYKLKSFEPGAKLVLERHALWWGKHEGNVTEVVFRPIKSNATRMAALMSGEVDFVIDPPPQDLERLRNDPRFAVVSGAELRTLMLAFDVARDELLYSSVKGRNPFKDKRVREAVGLAIDREALKQKVLRGLAIPTASLVPKGAVGYSAKAAQVPAADLDRAKKLMRDAGFKEGFNVTLDCSNDREQMCSALAGMLSKIGIEVALNVSPRAKFFQRTNPLNREFSMYFGGMGASTGDGAMMLESLLHTFNVKEGHGNNNAAGVANPKYDELLAASNGELDAKKRDALFEALQMAEREEHYYIPLYQPVVPWIMRRGVSAVHRADNYLDLRWVTVEKR